MGVYHMCQGLNSLYWGMVIQPLIGNQYNLYIMGIMGIESPIIGLMITIPWYMGQNGKLDPSTYCISMFSVNVFHQSGKP